MPESLLALIEERLEDIVIMKAILAVACPADAQVCVYQYFFNYTQLTIHIMKS